MSERRHEPLLPGFREMADSRRQLAHDLVGRRVALGLTQTQVAARMGTSQSAVARLESGDADIRLSTLERYAAAVGHVVGWTLLEPAGASGAGGARGASPPFEEPVGRRGPATGGRHGH